jgi:hypothetical protein
MEPGLDGPWVEVVRERVEMPAGGLPEHGGQQFRRELGDLTDRVQAPVVELAGGDGADAPEPLDLERVQERELPVGRDEQQPVGLRDAARDLREELRSRDPDRDREPDFLCDSLSQSLGDLERRAEAALHAAHVEERLVDRKPFDERRGVVEDAEDVLARCGVGVEARRHDARVRAEPERGLLAHRRVDAEALRLVARGEHDAHADDRRHAAQAGVVALLDGSEERVEIRVQDHERMFAYSTGLS